MTSFQQVRDGFGEQGQVRVERLLNVKGSQVQILSARLTGSDSPRGSEPFFTRSVDSSRRRRGPAATDQLSDHQVENARAGVKHRLHVRVQVAAGDGGVLVAGDPL